MTRATRDRDARPNRQAVATSDAVDRGAIADKVPGFDPAAAPLETDAESAGTPTPPADRVLPDKMPPATAELAADPGGTERQPYRVQDRLIWPVIGALALIAAVFTLAALFAG